jgi:hypothetical protein
MRVLTAMALAQKFPPAAPSPTTGQRPFSTWRVINGARASGVTFDLDGGEYRASSANEVGSVPNCAPP